MIIKEDLEKLKNLTMVQAAKELGVSKSTLQRKCKEYNISFSEKERSSQMFLLIKN